MADPSNAGIIQVGEERWIPGSQRADGSYRKERKVRPGFVPLEDVKRYSNARIEASRESTLPPGAKPKSSIPGAKAKPSIPGAKKKTTATTASKETAEKPKPAAKKEEPLPATDQSKEKKIKALNKKLRQIKELEQKLIKGEQLNEEQHEKVKKGKSLREELEKLSL